MTSPLTVLFHSNAPWVNTGYGTQTKQVVERFHRDGHAIAVNANYGLQGMKTLWESVPIFPMGVEAYSNDTVRANFAAWKRENPDNPAHVIVLFDAWTMPREMYEGIPVSIWTMVDHQPIPPKVLSVLQWPNVTPIAVTKFGLQQMQRAGLSNARYIPMAIDTKLYRPTEKFDGKTGREIMGLPDEDLFIVSAINANKAGGAGGIHRKAWAENILAFSIFAQDKPDARLYLHTERFGNHGGLALDVLLKAVGLKPEQYKFVNQHAMHNGIPNEAMAAIYTATDCLLASTLGEGFGLTLLEAQSCGTVAICNNFTAQPELLGDGWLTEGQPYWDGVQLAWFNTPNIPSIVDALEAAYARGRGRSKKAREHAKQYDADVVWKRYWKPYLAELSREPAVEVVESSVPQTWDNGKDCDPLLTLYVPAYKRPELQLLLQSMVNQLDDRCEVIVTDDDPQGSAWPYVQSILGDAQCRVEYHRSISNLGSISNCMRAYEMARAPWLWVLGDDDQLMDGAVAAVLDQIIQDDVDRLILLTEAAPQNAAGVTGTPAELAEIEPGLLIAATCTTANVWRIASLDRRLAMSTLDTAMSYSFGDTGCKRVRVLDRPAIVVGANHAGEALTHAQWTGDMQSVWVNLLTCYGVENVGPEHFAWNFVSVQQSRGA